MTREEAIERWKAVAKAVFWAEGRIIRAYKDALKTAKSLPEEEQTKVMNDYCEAVAIEIVNATPEEELNEMT